MFNTKANACIASSLNACYPIVVISFAMVNDGALLRISPSAGDLQFVLKVAICLV